LIITSAAVLQSLEAPSNRVGRLAAAFLRLS